MMRSFLLALIVSTVSFAQTWTTPSKSQIDAVYPRVESLYMDLHRNPELSLHEVKTDATMADNLRKLGFDVTTGVGGTGVVGVLKNGSGPVVLLRTELDALPVEEKTGLPFASKVRMKNDAGQEVSVMHACGHDVHITSMLGTAKLLSEMKNQWQGTLVILGQPAEEVVDGARSILRDGLYERFAKPDY